MAENKSETAHKASPMRKSEDQAQHYARWILKRILLVIVLTVIMLIIGSMIGYRLGGGNPFKVFLPSTWSHIFDFFR